MNVVIEKGVARGRITAPASKSMAHRLLIAASLAEGVSVIHGVSACEDVLATIDCLSALGAKITLSGDKATVTGFNPKYARASSVLSARESGSTLRFILPLALLSGNRVKLTGAGRLLERPMSVYQQLCSELGMLYEREGQIIHVCGPMPSVDFTIPGNISSQFITGILLTLPYLQGDRRIHIKAPIESRSYIDLTICAMQSFGVDVCWESESVIFVRGGSKYFSRNVTVEGDYSGAAFIEALALFGGDVRVDGLRDDSLQGDRVYREYFRQLSEGFAHLSLEDCPDLAPILFVCAAAKHGAKFTGTARLKIKESDRAAVMAEELSKFGARINVGENDVVVEKCALHTPGEVLYSHNDHRIAMSLAVLCTLFGGEISGAESVNKSYPDFFENLLDLGIKVRKNDT